MEARGSLSKRRILGLYGAREKSDEHFVAAHFDTDADDVILLNPTGALNGDPQPFEDA